MTKEYAQRRALEMHALAQNMWHMARNTELPSGIRYEAAVQATSFEGLRDRFNGLAKEIQK